MGKYGSKTSMIKIFKKIYFIFFKKNISKENFWEQTTVEEWTGINYPWKPNDTELSNISKILKKLNKSSKVALLGSTPEIRSLARNEKIKLDVIDLSKKMYYEMNKISRSSKNEKFIKSDWIKYFSKKKNTYDLIIGDLIERLLPENKLILLSKNLNKALKPKGRILLRGDYYIDRKQNSKLNIKSEINKLVKTKLTNPEIVDRLFFGLSPEFINISEKISLIKMKKKLIKIKTPQNFTNQEIEIINLLIQRWSYSPLSFYCRTAQKIESIWKQNFTADDKIEKRIFNNRIIALRLWQRKR